MGVGIEVVVWVGLDLGDGTQGRRRKKEERRNALQSGILFGNIIVLPVTGICLLYEVAVSLTVQIQW